MNPAKFKVIDLRSELSSRGLDTKGNKAALVERLQEALDKESGSGIKGKSEIDKEAASDAEPSPTLDGVSTENTDNKGDQDRDSIPAKTEHQADTEQKDLQDTAMEVDIQNSIKKEGFEEDVKPGIKIKTENVDIKECESSKEDRKRKRSSSPKRDHSRSSREEEPELSDNNVVLSWYDSDLNLIIERDGFTKASPMSTGGFGYIWAGVRSTFGYVKGRLCYQVKLIEYNNVSHLDNEPTPNVLRVGWSIFDTSLQLGEEPLSFGYGGTGKVAVNCKFRDYGKNFGLHDVVTAYIDFNGSEISMSYAVNNEFLGEAFKVCEDELKGRALAPHILSKNLKFEVNFGQEDPWFPVEEGYAFPMNVLIAESVAGPRRPEKKGDCEMLMMCGLPGAGKTYWANKHCAENPDKHYNILGTNALIDKMKVEEDGHETAADGGRSEAVATPLSGDQLLILVAYCPAILQGRTLQLVRERQLQMMMAQLTL